MLSRLAVAPGCLLLERVDFAPLHVTRVVARVDAERGLAEASIVSAGAPVHVHAGQLVRVRLRVRVVPRPAGPRRD